MTDLYNIKSKTMYGYTKKSMLIKIVKSSRTTIEWEYDGFAIFPIKKNLKTIQSYVLFKLIH